MIAFLAVLFVALLAVAIWRSMAFEAGGQFGHTHFAGLKPLRGLPFLIAAFLMLLLLMSYSEVNAGTIGVVKRLGKPVSQMAPGAPATTCKLCIPK